MKTFFKKILILGPLGISYCAFMAHANEPQAPKTVPSINKTSLATTDASQDITALFELSHGAKQLSDLTDLIDIVLPKWKGKDDETYFRLVLIAVRGLQNQPFRDHEGNELNEQARKLSLQYGDEALLQPNIPANVEASLLLSRTLEQYLAIRSMPRDKWPAERKKTAAHWLRVDKSLRSLIKTTEHIKMSDVSMPFVPPKGVIMGPLGSYPKDPEQRRLYDEAARERGRKSGIFFKGREWKSLLKSYRAALSHYLITAYSNEPDNLEEIVDLLKDLGDIEYQEQILNGIAQRRQQASVK